MLYSTGKRECVLVYFANETHLTPAGRRNYARITAILRNDTDGNGREVALQLLSDLRDFPAAVREEVEVLAHLAKCNSTVKILVFTNELSHRQKALLAHDGALIEIDFNHTVPIDYILESSPNSHIDTLLEGLTLAGKIFPPATHTFTLIIKSHAGDQNVITPRLTIHSELIDSKEILEIANGRPAQKANSENTSSIGVSASDFFKALMTTRSLLFDHVFLEVCAGRAAFSDAQELPANVATLTVPSKGLQYKNIDYNALIDSKNPIRLLQAQIRAQFQVDTLLAERRYIIELVIWWLPLAASIAGWIIFCL
jgi:hypothetical protein